MIPYEFDYYRPDTIEEAVNIYKELDSKGKKPLYYGGGSEIISMARVHNIHTKAVIDLKAIPECNVLETQDNRIFIGSSITLSDISESRLFPLLGKACGRIADHTMQCRITIGGNIAGTIIYREAVLPLLLSDCQVIVAGSGSLKQIPLYEIFDGRLKLEKGEFIVKFIIGREFVSLPYIHVKKTKAEKIDYPLISVAAIKKDDRIRLGLSGVCSFPFRSLRIEDAINDRKLSYESRVKKALGVLPSSILSDVSGSGAYRRFVLENTLVNTLEALEVPQ